MTEKNYDPRIDHLMARIHTWITRLGGATGKLTLEKRALDDGQWEILLVESSPESTTIFNPGDDISQDTPFRPMTKIPEAYRRASDAIRKKLFNGGDGGFSGP